MEDSGLPLKNGEALAQRLGSNNRRLTQYGTVICNYLKEGLAGWVPEAQVGDTANRVYYDGLSTGPSLNPDLLQMILGFRQPAIAFAADIEKAFLQIVVK